MERAQSHLPAEEDDTDPIELVSKGLELTPGIQLTDDPLEHTIVITDKDTRN